MQAIEATPTLLALAESSVAQIQAFKIPSTNSKEITSEANIVVDAPPRVMNADDKNGGGGSARSTNLSIKGHATLILHSDRNGCEGTNAGVVGTSSFESTIPMRSSPHSNLSSPMNGSIPANKSEDRIHKVDRFGFIQNMDDNGNIIDRNDDDDYNNNNSMLQSRPVHPIVSSQLAPYSELQKIIRREKKWQMMIANYYDKMRLPPRRLLIRRCRKGLPDSVRGSIWCAMGGVPTKITNHRGLYDKLVRKTIESSSDLLQEAATTTASMAASSSLSIKPPSLSAGIPHAHNDLSDTPLSAQSKDSSNIEPIKHTKSFRNVQDTIDRDIHRTFPRHSLFYEEHHSSNVSDIESINGELPLDVCGTREISCMIRELELNLNQEEEERELSHPISASTPATRSVVNNNGCESSVLSGRGGQASLRRVLKAYSLYDREIGYCQGMNFIAGMFLTLMTEEETFWLLVAVMNDLPCKIRGLFGEGMQETHKVLYVAEKLIHQFLPRLARHLDREHIHITMYATQWLLTQYTSSFRFDLVVRVWDCFLAEGWKITYRVMLSLLQQWQAEILKMSFEEILAFFRELPDRVDGSAVVRNAIKIPLRRRRIAMYEKEWLALAPHQPN